MDETRSREVAVVDDDAAVLESFRFMLELAGFTVATYPSAIEYLARDGGHARCLILDQHMPIMSGIDLVARLRSSGNGIPVMLVTSAPTSGLEAKAVEFGVARVLEKPPTEDDLIGFVASCPA